MKIIVHGYDYAIPSFKKRFSLKNVCQYPLNKLIDTGKWLARPLSIKGITDPETQRKIVKFMIFEFNEMLKTVADEFDNVYHLDCRSIAPNHDDWFDELHLKPHNFRKVAGVYSKLINGEIPKQSTIRVVD